LQKKKALIKLRIFLLIKKVLNIKKNLVTFDIITANHVCAHVENLNDFFTGVKNLLKEMVFCI
jgi:2-polyprenyl-3-methyl-5-hydroxy-6-metoxy-1,4-benzoquinol methylase